MAISENQIKFHVTYSGPLQFVVKDQWRKISQLRMDISEGDATFSAWTSIRDTESVKPLQFHAIFKDAKVMTFSPEVAKTMKLSLEMLSQDSSEECFLNIDILNLPDFKQGTSYLIWIETAQKIQAIFTEYDE